MQTINLTKPTNETEIAVTTQLGKDALFIEGDKIRLLATLDRPAYVAVVLENARGEIQQLYPTGELARGVLHPAGMFQAIPKEGQCFPVVVPYGMKTAWLIASDRALPAELLSGGESSPSLAHARGTWLEWTNSYTTSCHCWFAQTFVQFITEPAAFSLP